MSKKKPPEPKTLEERVAEIEAHYVTLKKLDTQLALPYQEINALKKKVREHEEKIKDIRLADLEQFLKDTRNRQKELKQNYDLLITKYVVFTELSYYVRTYLPHLKEDIPTTIIRAFDEKDDFWRNMDNIKIGDALKEFQDKAKDYEERERLAERKRGA